MTRPGDPAGDHRGSRSRRPLPAGPVERMERTSPTRSGGTARHRSAKIEFHVFNLNERGSHGQDYSGRTRFGKADNPSACDRRGGSGGAAQGGAAGAGVGAAGAVSAMRSGDGSLLGGG